MASAQDYEDHALNGLPRWFRGDGRALETIKALAEQFKEAQDQSDTWREQANILDSTGIWLDQHARDRNTRRQNTETDAALRDRLRNFDDALNFTAVLAAAQSVVDAEGVVGTVAMVELREERGFFLTRQAQTGTGGVFSGAAPMLFTPDAGFEALIERPRNVTFQVTFSGSLSAGNDGTFACTVSGSALSYTNGSGVAETDAGVSWTIDRVSAAPSVLTNRKAAYLSRGYRMGSDIPTLVIILPFGCTESTRLAVAEATRQKRAAGVRTIVECRANP